MLCALANSSVERMVSGVAGAAGGAAGTQRHKNAYRVTNAYLRDIHAAHRYDSDDTFPFGLPHFEDRSSKR